MKFLFLILFLFLSCKVADPNYRIKPLLNEEYTGFISRTYFQVVVEIPITREEVSIEEERKICKKEAYSKRDKLVIPILKDIAMESKRNESLRDRELKIDSESKDTPSQASYRIYSYENSSETNYSKNVKDINAVYLNKGEFNWFLNSLVLHKEDYTKNDKCIFIYRKIEDNLFAKVQNTKLGIIGRDKKIEVSPQTQTDPQQNLNPQNTQQNTTPIGTSLPQGPR